MEEDFRPPPQDKTVRKLSSFVKKLGDEEINIFLEVLSALMARVPAPGDARKSYLREVEIRLRNNGVDFLSKSRVFPTFGLKLLGNDRDGFPIPGFKQQKGKCYPSLFAWYWGELDRLSKLSRPRSIDVQRAQRVLTVLSFAKMIKVNSLRQIRSSLTDFERRVAPDGALVTKDEMSSSYHAIKARTVFNLFKEKTPKYYGLDGEDLVETLGYKEDLSLLPEDYDFTSVSSKPSALKDPPRLPQRVTPGWNSLFWWKLPPYGKVHILTETAGKLRFICPYNTPFVHSTGLYSRSRAILRSLRQDASEDQTVGHRFVQKELSKGNEMCVSADLSNFTDDISPDLLRFGLRCLGLEKLRWFLLNLPVTLPNGNFIIPEKLMMGLKGCFELSTLCHHYVVQRAGITRYTMVGDDLFFKGDINTYLEAIEQSGWKLNRAKTVYSKTAAVFCGEMFWFGQTVSPFVPKVSSCFRNGKRRKASALFSCTRSAIANLNKIYSRRGVGKVIYPLLKLLRSSWKSVIALEIPQKLRGLGLAPSVPNRSLCSYIESRRDILRMSKLSIGIKKELVSTQRWFGLPIELTPNPVNEFDSPYFPTLLRRGAVRLVAIKANKAAKKCVCSLDLSDVLEWYYFDARLELSQFKCP